MPSQGGAIVLRVSTLFLAFLPKRGMPAYGREIVRSGQKANRVVPVENVAVPNTPSNDLSRLIGKDDIGGLSGYVAKYIAFPCSHESMPFPSVSNPSGEGAQLIFSTDGCGYGPNESRRSAVVIDGYD